MECRGLHCPDVMKITQLCWCSELEWPKLASAGGRALVWVASFTAHTAWGSLVQGSNAVMARIPQLDPYHGVSFIPIQSAMSQTLGCVPTEGLTTEILKH